MYEWIESIFTILQELGYLGIAIGLMIEIIPSEIVLAYGGFLISIGEINFLGAVIAGTIGGTLAHFILYLFGYYFGRPFFDRYGKWLFIKQNHLMKVEKWFEEYGNGVVFLARFIPVIRHAVSIPAGIARMNVWSFLSLTIAAIIPWTVLFLLLGIQLGNHWSNIEEFAKPFLAPIILITCACFVVFFIIKFFSKKKQNA